MTMHYPCMDHVTSKHGIALTMHGPCKGLRGKAIAKTPENDFQKGIETPGLIKNLSLAFSEMKKFSKNIQFKNNVRNVPSEIG